MLGEDLHTEIEGRFDSLRARREELRAAAEAQVVERRWSSASWMADPRPFYLERHRLPRERLRDRPADGPHGDTEYGYDAQGRPVLVRQFAFGRPDREEYLSHGSGHTESYDFAASPRAMIEQGAPEWVLLAVTRQTFDDEGRMTGWDRGSTIGWEHGVLLWQAERYHRAANGRIERIEELRAADGEEQVERWEARFVYDDDGRLAAIRKSGTGWNDDVEWRRPPRSLRPAARKVEDTLVEALRRWAREHWPDEPVYCFAVGFSDPALPGAPGLGTDRERQAVLDDPDEYGVGPLLWNPAEFEIFDPDFDPAVGDPEYADAQALLEQEWDMTGDDEAAVRLLTKVARRLAAMDWSEHPVTPDLVVLAIDMESEEQAHVESRDEPG